MSFNIPPGVLAQHIIALGKTRSGKSSKLRVLVEGLLDDDKPVCIIDPKGDWWGIKSSADGKKAGFPIVIFGGEHADVPINDRSGTHVAELIATGNRSCLIDLGGWTVGERTRFFIDFASSLFKHARGARHLVIDEVHNFAPQGKIMNPDAGKMLHWANRLASEGAGKGITIIAASQRPQKVAKDFVTSCETLIANKVIHKLDREAIKDWIDGCADPLKGKEVIASLAQLKKPQAWVWCPEIDYGPVLIDWPMFKTYDSFKPQPAAQGRLKGWADVDLEEVKTKLATVVHEAAANDPGALKKRIAELERQLKTQVPTADPKALTDAHNQGFAVGLKTGFDDAESQLGKFLNAYMDSIDTWLMEKPGRPPLPGFNPPLAKVPHRPTGIPIKNMVIVKAKVPHVPRGTNGESKLSKPARAVLAILSQFPEGCEKGKLTLLSGYAWSGTFSNALGALRTAGLIEGDNGGVMRITSAGLAHGPFPELPQGDDLVHYWVTNPMFSKPGRQVLEVLADGRERTKEELCEATGYEWSGTFSNALGQLRTAGVLVGKNTEKMRFSPEIIP